MKDITLIQSIILFVIGISMIYCAIRWGKPEVKKIKWTQWNSPKRNKDFDMRSLMIQSSQRCGRGYFQYMEYIAKVDKGDRAIVVGPKYVVLSLELHENMNRIAKWTEQQLDECRDELYAEKEEIKSLREIIKQMEWDIVLKQMWKQFNKYAHKTGVPEKIYRDPGSVSIKDVGRNEY